MKNTYCITRHYQRDDVDNKVIKKGLTLEEAQEHCKDSETSSRTATSLEALDHTAEYGAWFDGYEEEKGGVEYVDCSPDPYILMLALSRTR